MLNFKVKGKFASEDELIGDKKLSENAIQFREGDSVQDVFIKGFLIGLPFFIIMEMLMYLRLRDIDYKLQMNIQTIMVFVVMLVVLYALIYVHEVIHGIFYPMNAEKTIWKYPEQGAFFIYCDEPISKIRFIILCAAPSIILGIVPYIIWLVYAVSVPMPYTLAIGLSTLIMTVMSMGDFANIYNAIRQVPKNAKVFNYGLHSYWIKEDRTKWGGLP